MALTLTEGAKLSNDVLVEGVIESVINDSPILQRLPFVEIVGNGLTYNRENVAPTAAFYAVGETWAENTPTFTQVTTALSILGGVADAEAELAELAADAGLAIAVRRVAERETRRRLHEAERTATAARAMEAAEAAHLAELQAAT